MSLTRLLLQPGQPRIHGDCKMNVIFTVGSCFGNRSPQWHGNAFRLFIHVNVEGWTLIYYGIQKKGRQNGIEPVRNESY